jgi:hypothetical protein
MSRRFSIGWVTKVLITAAVSSAVLFGSALQATPADAFVVKSVEGQVEFRGFVDAQNMDVCWNTTLPPIWVEATRRALLAWNEATTGIRFRSYRPVTYRPVSATDQPDGCDVFVNNELAQYDTTTPGGVDPKTGKEIFIVKPDGLISAHESNTRAIGGRTSVKSTQGSKTWWISKKRFVKVNTGSVWMQGRTAADLDSFQSTMVHELGHVIGLEHTQEEFDDVSVMYDKTNIYLVPQPDDIAGMAFIYDKVTYPQPAREPFVTTDPLTPMDAMFWVADVDAEPVETPVETPLEPPVEDEEEPDADDEIEIETPVTVPVDDHVETPVDETPVAIPVAMPVANPIDETADPQVGEGLAGVSTATGLEATDVFVPDVSVPQGGSNSPTDAGRETEESPTSTAANAPTIRHPALPSLLALGSVLVLDLAVVLFFIYLRRLWLARRRHPSSSDTPPVLGDKIVSPLRRTSARV